MSAHRERVKREVKGIFFSAPKRCEGACRQLVCRSRGGYVPIGRNRQRWICTTCQEKGATQS